MSKRRVGFGLDELSEELLEDLDHAERHPLTLTETATGKANRVVA